MGVLCSRYHVSLIAPGLSTGPCRVSNLLGFEQNKGGEGEIEAARGAGEGSDFYLLILACRRGPTFLLYQLRALAFPQVSSKKDKKLALDSNIPRRDFLAHFRCKHSQEQSPGADISVIVSAYQCADASRKWA